ncbi:hypothetical protein KM043_017309 [Ampulex compressa]|nr:hypothetical protein KM043_017309 [Ampulex compressa]
MGNPRTLTIFLVYVAMSNIAMHAAGSAIPMWEFLSRDEKMSHLYRLFSKQVARFCVDSSRPDCNKNLLVSGIRNLASMDDNLLDKLDPYQRGAKEMIWRAMVGTNRFSARVGHETEESYFTTGGEPLATSGSETNGLGEETASGNDYARQADEHTGPYLVGPMVIRVYPDGRPVPEDSTRPLPRDEDAEELRFVRVPSVEEIEANGGEVFYGKPGKEPAKRPSFEKNRQQVHRRQVLVSIGEQMRMRAAALPYERRPLREAPASRVRFY